VTPARRRHRCAETVLLQAEIRQAVVAAFPAGPVGRQRLIETGNLADPGLQGAALEARSCRPPRSASRAAACAERPRPSAVVAV